MARNVAGETTVPEDMIGERRGKIRRHGEIYKSGKRIDTRLSKGRTWEKMTEKNHALAWYHHAW